MRTRTKFCRPDGSDALLTEMLHLLGHVSQGAILGNHIVVPRESAIQIREAIVSQKLIVDVRVGFDEVRRHLSAVGRHDTEDYHLRWMFGPEGSLNLNS
uniref:Uncharacterized protein n=1 Tax=Lepeophtheirus salmonis TaxID=72036 RepID=A0A0K2TSZ3_LEPSM